LSGFQVYRIKILITYSNEDNVDDNIMKIITYALIPLILSIGISPAIPFSDGADIPNLLQICIDKVWVERTAGKRSGQIVCVFPSTAEKLVERGWGTMLVIVEDISDEKSIKPDLGNFRRKCFS